jgi:hypothetical protein
MKKLDLTICTAYGSEKYRASGLQQFSIADVWTRPGCINLFSALYITLGRKTAKYLCDRDLQKQRVMCVLVPKVI